MRSVLRCWWFSLTMFVVYGVLFFYWKQFPSRMGFILSGTVTTIGLVATQIYAWRRSYFVNRIDLCLHAYVIGDLVIETALYEVLRLFIHPTASEPLLTQIHNNHHYLLCTIVLASLVGGYHAYARRKVNLRTLS